VPRPACLIVTGGLGPTLDDVTREAVAASFGAPLAENAQCREAIEAMFSSRGWTMNPTNLRQAFIPAGAEPLANPVGTAPGFHLHMSGCHLFAMPGVPAEMVRMWVDQVAPRLARLAPPRRVLADRTLRTFGLGESTVGQRIENLMRRGRNPQVGTLASGGVVSIRMRASAATEAEARRLLDRDEASVRAQLRCAVVGEATLPQAVAALLTRRGATLAAAESCTGGLVAHLVTDVPGASAFFLEAAVTYSNASKTSRLGVSESLLAEHGAVSDPVARAMAEGMRGRSGADYAVSTTGIAGPGGGTERKPVGLVHLALAGPEGTTSRRVVLPGDRERIRERAAMVALDMLRLRLMAAEAQG
jgi:nicotinamide-nucleotide amidase